MKLQREQQDRQSQIYRNQLLYSKPPILVAARTDMFKMLSVLQLDITTDSLN